MIEAVTLEDVDVVELQTLKGRLDRCNDSLCYARQYMPNSEWCESRKGNTISSNPI